MSPGRKHLLQWLWLASIIPGSALADDVPTAARALWADLTADSAMVPAFLSVPSFAPPETTRAETRAGSATAP